ncbi:MAG TPA: lipid-transfer protein [Actinomycetota bacterium]
MRRVGIVAVAQTDHARHRDDATAAELLYPVVKEAVAASGLSRHEIDYTCAASSDFLEGRPFSFGFALDAAGAVPPIEESHIEGDGAWAAYDAWVRIQAGLADSALVVAWGKSSEGSLPHVLNATLDPFWESPLGLDAVALAALQAQALGLPDEQLHAIVARNRAAARANPHAQITAEPDPASPFIVEPFRREHLPPISDGACALVMAAEEVLARLDAPVAWIGAAAHASDAASISARDLTLASSARAAIAAADPDRDWRMLDVAEVMAPFPHQEPMLLEAFSINVGAVNPSGGALAANPIMATGLVRLAEAALQVTGTAGLRQVPGARRGLAHATAGHCLQSNIVFLLEGTP